MRYDPEQHHRRSIRLKGYDYSQAGAYFVTICVQGRACLFGEIMRGEMHPSAAGRMVEQWWLELGRRYPAVQTDEYCVMPNLFHGIILITAADGADATGAALRGHSGGQPPASGQPRRVAPTNGAVITAPTLGAVIDWFKTMTTNEYIRGVKTLDWPPFERRVWQRNYYEHIIRSEAELNRIQAYIASNALRWALDMENPLAHTPAAPAAQWQR